jgi:hypothetical protein
MKSAFARAVVLAIGMLATGSSGCGGTQGSARDAAAADLAALSSRLQGTWALTTFRPAVPLEPMLQAFLAAQFNTLLVRINGFTISADSATLHYSQPFQLRDVIGNRFRIVTTSPSGVTYASDCMISSDSNEVSFVGLIEPWRGEGVIRRR